MVLLPMVLPMVLPKTHIGVFQKVDSHVKPLLPPKAQ